MIEIIRVRRCDICGTEMADEHVSIVWPDCHKTDVCKECTKRLNSKLKQLRIETDNLYVVGIKNIPWFKTGKEKPLTFLGTFTNPTKAEECKENHKDFFDRVEIVNDLDAVYDILAAGKEEEEEEDVHVDV